MEVTARAGLNPTWVVPIGGVRDSLDPRCPKARHLGHPLFLGKDYFSTRRLGHPGCVRSQFELCLYCRCLGKSPPRRLAVHSDSISTIPISPVA